jgi:hypothetical protein
MIHANSVVIMLPKSSKFTSLPMFLWIKEPLVPRRITIAVVYFVIPVLFRTRLQNASLLDFLYFQAGWHCASIAVLNQLK